MKWYVSDSTDRGVVSSRLQEVEVWASMMDSSFMTCEDMFSWRERRGAYGYRDGDYVYVCCFTEDKSDRVVFILWGSWTVVSSLLESLLGPSSPLSYEKVVERVCAVHPEGCTPYFMGEALGILLCSLLFRSVCAGGPFSGSITLGDSVSVLPVLESLVVGFSWSESKGVVSYHSDCLCPHDVELLCEYFHKYLISFTGGILTYVGSDATSRGEKLEKDGVALISRLVNGVFKELLWGFFNGCRWGVTVDSVAECCLELTTESFNVMYEASHQPLMLVSGFDPALGFASVEALMSYVLDVSSWYGDDGNCWWDQLRGGVVVS